MCPKGEAAGGQQDSSRGSKGSLYQGDVENSGDDRHGHTGLSPAHHSQSRQPSSSHAQVVGSWGSLTHRANSAQTQVPPPAPVTEKDIITGHFFFFRKISCGADLSGPGFETNKSPVT